MRENSPTPRLYYALWGSVFLAVYAILLWAPFVYDDAAFILGNPLVTGPWPGMGSFLLSSFAGKGEYGPLVTAGHWLLYHAAGGQPVLYRLTSLLLHAADSLLLLGLARRLLKSDRAAFAAAVLFSLYPAHAEVLALSSFKKHMGVAFFGLLMLNLDLSRLPRPRRWAAGWACLVLALLCKESALVLPPLALVVASSSDGGWPRARREWGYHAGLWALAAAYVGARLFVVPRSPAALVGGAWAPHLLTSAKMLLWYLRQLVWPAGLCLEHSLAPETAASAPRAILVSLGAAGALAGAGLLWRRDRLAGAGAAWALGCLLPFLNLVPFLNLSLVSDRYLYLSSAGFFLAAVRLGSLAAAGLRGRIARRVPELACLAAAGVYAALAFAQSARFADPWTLWQRDVLCAPGNPRAHAQLAYVYLKQLMYPEAAAEFEAAAALDPRFRAMVSLDLGQAYAGAGRLEDALRVTKAEVLREPSPEALNNLGILYLRLGQPAQARAMLESALALGYRGPYLWLNLGACDLALGRLDDAREELERAARSPELRPKALAFLAETALKRGRRREAVGLYEESLSGDPMQWEAVRGLAGLYAALGRRPDAVVLLSRYQSRLERARAALAASPRPEDARARREAERLLEVARRQERALRP